MRPYIWPLFSLLGFALFLALVHQVPPSINNRAQPEIHDHIVISAPVQLLMFAGDRFLAADLELMRLAATASVSGGEETTAYMIRAHRLVSQLNPCHEDNYYLGNALLTWGGAQEDGNDLLRRATECRHWDEIPPFLYGINQYYFNHNSSEAVRLLELAASRSPDNYAALRKAAIMIEAEEITDDQMARSYLQQQLESTTDERLRQMLEKRVARLDGLIALHDAQQRYEAQFKRPLSSPNELLEHGLLQSFPTDPLRIGYEFRDGRFILRQLKIAGMEERK